MIQSPQRIRPLNELRSIRVRFGRYLALAAILSSQYAPRTSAAVTYVDGVWGAGENTTYLDGSVFTPGPNNAAAGDDLWRERTGGAGFGHNSTIMESNGNANNATTNPENAPMLRTTISGLTPSTEYTIYAYFWSQTSALQDWKLKATINPANINTNGGTPSVLDDFLPTTATLSFSKFGSLTAPVATNTPALPVGFDGADNLGVTFDAAGMSTAYFATPTRIKSTDNTLVMFQANLGVAIANGSGQVNVYVDDLEEQPSNNLRTWYDGVGYDLAGQPTLTINRQTGAMVFTTGVARDVIGYSIQSAIGALNQVNWTTITGHYDAPPGGNGSIDPNDTWRVLTDPASNSDLSEAELGETGPLDGGLFAAGTNLNFGNTWRKYYTEDIQMQILRNDASGTIDNVAIVYTGNGGLPYQKGDFSFNGSIGPEDYSIFIGNLFGNMPSSVVAAYALGDITGDLAVDYNDLVVFRDIYDIANGAGAFQEMVSSVPEPHSLALIGCLGAGLLACHRRRVRSIHLLASIVSSAPTILAVATSLLLNLSAAVAQTTYVDATETPGGNTTRLDGTDFTAIPDNLNDGLWRKRAFGNNDTIFETNAANVAPGENGHMLVTTITGLVPNVQYYVYSYFWSNPVENWRIKSTVHAADVNDNATPGDLSDDFIGLTPATAFSANGATNTTTAPLAVARNFAAPTLIRDLDTSPNILLYEAVLGTTAADATGKIKVYIDDVENQSDARLRTFYDGVGSERFQQLKLQVNTVTGATKIMNPSGAPLSFDYYQITSAMNSLNLAAWQSLDIQNIDAVDGTDPGSTPGDSQLEGWDAAGGSDDGILGETKFLSSSSLPDQAIWSLGKAFQPGDPQDLVFSFEMGGRLRTGVVQYVSTPPILGDYDDSGVVDTADYAKWRSTFGSTTILDADGNGNHVIDAADYAIWRNVLSGGSGSGLGSGTASVPEPTTFTLVGIIALIGGTMARRRQNSLTLAKPIFLGLLAIATVALANSGVARAAVTNDRELWFGEDALEGPSQNAIIGSNNTAPLAAGNTADSLGPSGAYLDLTQSGDPVYANVGPSGLNRPGAANNTFGAKFDGVDDYLTGTPLNRPDELATIQGSYPLNYTGITARGAQMWVYPNAASIGVRRQTILFDTIDAGGVAISAAGKWHQANDGHFDEDDITSYVSVVGNQWYHVMHHVYPSTAAGSPKVTSGGADLGFTGVVYVNGIAVSANNDSRIVNERLAASRTGALFVGAEELPDLTDTSSSAIVGNYFDGVIDNLEMYVFGDNTGQGGQNYGTFNLFADNKWIANQIATTVPGGILKSGDLNRDGAVTSADVNQFVAGWLDNKRLAGFHNTVTAGDWETWTWGDLDNDGIVYLHDAFLMQKAMIQAGLGSSLSDLLGGSIPEPNMALLIIGASGIWFARWRRH